MLRVVRDAVEPLGTIIALSAVCFRGASQLILALQRNPQETRGIE